MKLVEVRIRKFRNFIDSGPVAIEPHVTCLVGKNESGKTAFLHALHRLMPAEGAATFDVQSQYPAWIQKRDRLKGVDLETTKPIEAIFEIEDEDLAAVEERFGAGVLKKRRLKLCRKYDGGLFYYLSETIEEKKFVEHVVGLIDWPHGTKTPANKTKTIGDLRTYAQELEDGAQVKEGDDEKEKEKKAERRAVAAQVRKALNDRVGAKGDLTGAVWTLLKSRVPRFLYFDEYSQLPYTVDIKRVLTADPSQLEPAELTARSLLRLGAADEDYLKNPDYETRKRELENVANTLTRDLRDYWTQNPDLRVEPDITMETETLPGNKGRKAVVDELKLRIRDDRHWLTLPFDEHSSGFRWFFSFLAAFFEYEYGDEPLVILLDEPALGLHAKAQADFLRYIEERLAPRCQVIYTTHSPFMVEPGRLERVRLVEDKTTSQKQEGANISADVTSTDADTLFPLQGALGYDLAQHLFIGPHNLVVEGTSDYTYLRVVSDYLAGLDDERTTLDERWSIVPVGGATQVPSFVALLGNHLDVTVLVDAQKKGHQRLANLADEGLLHKKRLLTVGQVTGRDEADIEDLFTEDDYLRLYNEAFGRSVSKGDLQGEDPIVRRLARHEGVPRFDHGRPADELLRRRDEILPELSEETLRRFEALFEAINATMEG